MLLVPELGREDGRGRSAHCPACGAHLDGRTTPPRSVVLCARCCTPLLWDSAFSVLTAEQLLALPEADRQRLCALLALQRAQLGPPRPN